MILTSAISVVPHSGDAVKFHGLFVTKKSLYSRFAFGYTFFLTHGIDNFGNLRPEKFCHEHFALVLLAHRLLLLTSFAIIDLSLHTHPFFSFSDEKKKPHKTEKFRPYDKIRVAGRCWCRVLQTGRLVFCWVAPMDSFPVNLVIRHINYINISKKKNCMKKMK
jgi:hypothetical protein